MASSSWGEATHKRIKEAFRLSNKKSAGLEKQVRYSCLASDCHCHDDVDPHLEEIEHLPGNSHQEPVYRAGDIDFFGTCIAL